MTAAPEEARTGLTTAPAVAEAPNGLGPVGWMRWGWRALTSMRTALLLLLLLAIAAAPGAAFPQRLQDPIAVQQFLIENPNWGPILDRLGMFEVYGSAWFAAIYVLLFISLLGCVIPRSLAHLRAMRAEPPPAPRYLHRLPSHRIVAGGIELEAVAAQLRANRWRVRVGDGWVAAEKGYLRETGNLVFHIALVGLLGALGVSALFGHGGKVIVREGTSFANVRSQYDSFTPGRLVDSDSLPPFALALDSFTATYQRDGEQAGAPRDFAANVTVTEAPDALPRSATIEVNEPLQVGGQQVFLVGHGYAPQIRIADKDGTVVFDDSVVFFPQDGAFTSTGVIKAPDARPPLGLQAIFLPTTTVDPVRGPVSSFPAADDPSVFLSAWTGDLQLDAVRNLFRLDTTGMTKQGIEALRPGESWDLPTGQRVTFVDVKQYASFSITRDPGRVPALIAVIAAIIGLTLSLLIHRRRIWVRTNSERTVLGGLTRSDHVTVDDELDELVDALSGRMPTPSR